MKKTSIETANGKKELKLWNEGDPRPPLPEPPENITPDMLAQERAKRPSYAAHPSVSA